MIDQAARERLLSLRRQAATLQEEVDALYTERKALKAESVRVQEAKGAHFRAAREWTPEDLADRLYRAGWLNCFAGLEGC